MSSAATALSPATPVKSPKKRAKSQRKKTSPTVSDLVLMALADTTERGGVSLPALKKALEARGYDVVKNRPRILITIRRLIANKSLIQTKGTGASGSFKLNKKPPTPRKRNAVKKKPKAKRVKRAIAKKAAGAATPAPKKSPKKKRKAKSPKKAKKPVAAKTPKKPKSPKKKVQRKVAKPTRTRAAAKK